MDMRAENVYYFLTFHVLTKDPNTGGFFYLSTIFVTERHC